MSVDWTVAAVGDAIVSSRLAPHDEPSDRRFHEMAGILRRADVTTLNLETNLFDLSRFEGWPAAERGGSYLHASPLLLDDLEALGFDLYARANNHAGDWGVEGLLATSRELDARFFAHAGVGTNLAAAARPAYLDKSPGRVAMVSFTTTFPVSSKAALQRSDIDGRPGCNGVTVHRRLRAPAATLSVLRGAMADLGDPRLFDKLDLGLVEGDDAVIEEELDHSDVDRVLTEIEKAASMADLVLVNGHAHEPSNEATSPPAWLEDVARRCIDAGAHAYLGHGPHQLRGLEIYSDRPIFYSLGNFAFHRETQDPVPAEQYATFGLDPITASPHEYVRARDESDHVLSMTSPVFYESLIPVMTFASGRLSGLDLHPIELGVDEPAGSRGTPRLAPPEHGDQILSRLSGLAEPYGTEIENNGAMGRWSPRH